MKKTENGQTTVYVGALFEKNLTTNVATSYYLANGQPVALRQNTAVSYLHGDHLGSTSLTTDASGNVVSRQKYLPFGQVRSTTGTLPTDSGFTGQRLDATGLMFYNARYYSAAIGRFISANTIVPEVGNPQALNRFSYVYNSPLNYIDPTGHFTEDEIKGFFGVDSWEKATAFFEKGGKLAGRWGWLKVLREAKTGDKLQVLDTYDPLWEGSASADILLEGRFVELNNKLYVKASSAGQNEYGYISAQEVAKMGFAFYLSRNGGHVVDPVIATLKYPYRNHLDSSKVNWGDVAVDSISAVASLVGANEVAQTFKYSSRVRLAGASIGTVLSGGQLFKSMIVDQDPVAQILAVGSFIPGPVGGGLSLASVYRDLQPGFYSTP